MRAAVGDDPHARIVEVFKRCDLDGDGTIDRTEFQKVLQRLDASYWTNEQVEALFTTINVRSDGRINFEEMLSWLCGKPSHQLFGLVQHKKLVLWCDSNARAGDPGRHSTLTSAGLEVCNFLNPEELLAEYEGWPDDVLAVITSMMESGGRREAGQMNAFGLFAFWRAECYRKGCRAPIFAIVSRSVNFEQAFAAGADIVESDWVKMQKLVVQKLQRGRNIFLCDSNPAKASESLHALVKAGFEAKCFGEIDELLNAIQNDDAKNSIAAVVSSMMESGGRKEAGKMNGFAAMAAIKKALRECACRPILAIKSGKAQAVECYAHGADLAICKDNKVLQARHPGHVWDISRSLLEVVEPPTVVVGEEHCEVCVDCGSGGIRVWQKQTGHFGVEFKRMSCASKPAVPIAECCKTAEGREVFAAFIKDLPSPCFVGATAGVRYAVESGEVTEEQVAALRGQLPDSCQFHVLSGAQEGLYELRSLKQYSDTGMISMGGRSMQLGLTDGTTYSLPFAAFTGADVLRNSAGSWPDKIRACADMYVSRCAQEQEFQGFSKFSGTFTGVTDTMDVARAMAVMDMPMSAKDFLLHLADFIRDLERGPPGNLNFVARVLAMQAVIACLFPEAELVFRSDIKINWAVGYLLTQGSSGA